MNNDKVLLVAIGLLLAVAPVEGAAFNEFPSFQAATSSLELINFNIDTDGQPTTSGDPIGNTYTTLGVDFPAGDIFWDDFGGPKSPPNGWLWGTSEEPDLVFNATFNVGGITAVGVYNVVNGSIPNGGVLEAFSGDMLLASVQSDAVGITQDFYGVTTTTAITRIKITAFDTNSAGLDNLYFGQAIPEPSSLALAAMSLMCVGCRPSRR